MDETTAARIIRAKFYTARFLSPGGMGRGPVVVGRVDGGWEVIGEDGRTWTTTDDGRTFREARRDG